MPIGKNLNRFLAMLFLASISCDQQSSRAGPPRWQFTEDPRPLFVTGQFDPERVELATPAVTFTLRDTVYQLVVSGRGSIEPDQMERIHLLRDPTELQRVAEVVGAPLQHGAIFMVLQVATIDP